MRWQYQHVDSCITQNADGFEAPEACVAIENQQKLPANEMSGQILALNL
jgi:hypothetical protein